MAIRVVNKTKWKTRDLRKILVRCRNKANTLYGGRLKDVVIEIIYTRSCGWIYVNGHANLRGRCSTIRVPHPIINMARIGNDGRTRVYEKKSVEFPVSMFADVAVHEFGHNIGIHHPDMKAGGTMYAEDEWAKKMAETHSVSLKPEPKPTPEGDIVQKRHNNCLHHIKDKTKRIKRLQNALKKWEKKREHYEKNYPERIKK